jgi:hypothetical protein
MQEQMTRVLNRIKLALIRLFAISVVWGLFFWLYEQTDLGEPRFKPLILGLIGLYLVLEAIVIVGSYWVDLDDDRENPDITAKLRKLSESIHQASKHYPNDVQVETETREPESCLS